MGCLSNYKLSLLCVACFGAAAAFFGSCSSPLDIEAARKSERFERDDIALGYYLRGTPRPFDIGAVQAPIEVQKQLLIENISTSAVSIWKVAFRNGGQGFLIRETAIPLPITLQERNSPESSASIAIGFTSSRAGLFVDTLDFYDINDNRIPAFPVECKALVIQ